MNRRIVRIAVGVIALAFLLVGIVQGGYYDTLQKAVRLCLECVGIG